MNDDDKKLVGSVPVVIKHDISYEDLSDLLCCAFEGGSNYWYMIDGFDGPVEGVEFKHITMPFIEGGAVLVSDKNEEHETGDGATQWRLDLDAVKRGITIMSEKYPRHMRDLLDENTDADTGDVFLQCCLFGEVIFG